MYLKLCIFSRNYHVNKKEIKKYIYFFTKVYHNKMYGVIAQLVERTNGIRKATGSIPVNSTMFLIIVYEVIFIFLMQI